MVVRVRAGLLAMLTSVAASSVLANTGPATAAAPSAAGRAPVAEPPAHDPLLVQKALDLSAEAAPDGRARLGLRLAVVARGPAEPWLVAVVNRGTEPARVAFDLRLLSLEVQPAAVESDDKRRGKAAKPVQCKLPANVRPDLPRPDLELVLAPGEGLVDAFDPRLYCFSAKRTSPLVGGAQVTVRLGFAEKTKVVWSKGKRETVVVEQSPPFVARRVAALPDLTEIHAERVPDPGPGAPRSDVDAIKELVAAPIEIAPASPPAPPSATAAPFELSTVEGSDARSARGVTVSVSLTNQSSQAKHVYFRREALSFEVSGPNGLVRCEPGPDVRAPDRLGFSRVKAGGRIVAKSLLIELCPEGTFDEPGLYLIDAGFDARRSGSEFGLDAFTGQLESQVPVTVRVQEGPKPLSPRHSPQPIQVGAR